MCCLWFLNLEQRLTDAVFYEIKLEISEVSEFSILVLILKSKTRKFGNFFKTCNCFVGGSWKFPMFPSLQFWPLCWNQKLENFFNCFVRGSWRFARFSSFQFWRLCWNRKLGNLGIFLRLVKLSEFVLL